VPKSIENRGYEKPYIPLFTIISMVKKIRIRSRGKTIRIRFKRGRLNLFIGRLRFRRKQDTQDNQKKQKAQPGKLAGIRNLITDEKMRILNEIRDKNPESIYELSKSLKRDIKSVREDIKRLIEAGFLTLKYIRKKGSKIKKAKPILKINRLNIIIEI